MIFVLISNGQLDKVQCIVIWLGFNGECVLIVFSKSFVEG